MAGVARMLIDFPRLVTLFDHRMDLALAHRHGHTVHGAVMRQGKNVYGFHRVRQDVFEFLRDLNTRDKAADFSLDACVLERNKAGHLAVFADDLQLAAALRLPGGSILRIQNDKNIEQTQSHNGGHRETGFHITYSSNSCRRNAGIQSSCTDNCLSRAQRGNPMVFEIWWLSMRYYAEHISIGFPHPRNVVTENGKYASAGSGLQKAFYDPSFTMAARSRACFCSSRV